MPEASTDPLEKADRMLQDATRLIALAVADRATSDAGNYEIRVGLEGGAGALTNLLVARGCLAEFRKRDL